MSLPMHSFGLLVSHVSSWLWIGDTRGAGGSLAASLRHATSNRAIATKRMPSHDALLRLDQAAAEQACRLAVGAAHHVERLGVAARAHRGLHALDERGQRRHDLRERAIVAGRRIEHEVDGAVALAVDAIETALVARLAAEV